MNKHPCRALQASSPSPSGDGRPRRRALSAPHMPAPRRPPRALWLRQARGADSGRPQAAGHPDGRQQQEGRLQGERPRLWGGPSRPPPILPAAWRPANRAGGAGPAAACARIEPVRRRPAPVPPSIARARGQGAPAEGVGLRGRRGGGGARSAAACQGQGVGGRTMAEQDGGWEGVMGVGGGKGGMGLEAGWGWGARCPGSACNTSRNSGLFFVLHSGPRWLGSG
jgi:hypothetical protein